MTAVQYAPDGRAIFTASDDGTVREWDVRLARQTRVIPQGGRVSLLAVSPDGSSLASVVQSSEASISVWDLATGRLRRKWLTTGTVVPADGLAFLDGGEALVTFGRDRGLRVLDVSTGLEREAAQPQFTLTREAGPFDGINDAGFSIGNRFLIVATTQSAHVADRATGVERYSFPCVGLNFTANRTTLALAIPGQPDVMELADGRARYSHGNAEAVGLVDLASGNMRRIQIPAGLVEALALSPDDKTLAVVSGRGQRTLRLYCTDDGRAIDAWNIPAAVPRRRALAFSPDGRTLAVGMSDTTIAFWPVSKSH